MIVHLLPAADGDAILIRSGNGEDSTNILVDGGRSSTCKRWLPHLQAVLRGKPLDLAVVTHVDADHVGGILELLRRLGAQGSVQGVWFNAYAQVAAAKAAMSKLEQFGVAQGDRLTTLLASHSLPVNQGFADGRVSLGPDGAIPSVVMRDFAISCLSPDDGKLAALEVLWSAWLAKAGLLPDGGEPSAEQPGLERFGASEIDVEALAAVDVEEDRAVQNGSSIAFLATTQGKRVLLAADAHPGLLLQSVRRLSPDVPLALDLFKVSHHGSRANISRELLAALDCTRFAFSTDGSRHQHPDRETVALVLTSTQAPKTLYFNYRQAQTTCWDREDLKERYNYEVLFPEAVDGYLSIDV